MKQRTRVFLSFLLAFCMYLQPIMHIQAQEVSNANGEVPTVEGNTLYANGTAVVIQKDTADGKIYVYDSTGKQKLLDSAVTTGYTIYGGSKNKDVNGDTSITVHGITMAKIYGGGFSDGSGSANVNGNASITITGSANGNNIYGGGYATGKIKEANASVSGTVNIAIESTPTSYHSNVNGGGYSESNSYAATADVGNVNVSMSDRSYSVRAGGTAMSNGMFLAQANVTGTLNLTLDQVDIREVYAGGYAKGAYAQADVNQLNTKITNSEVMILQSAGTADAGQANVNTVNVNIIGCPNLYGYVYGGGDASNGGTANVNDVKLHISNSIVPVEKQFGSWTAGAIYGGGNATGAGSQAVVGSVEMIIESSMIPGNIYGGGEATSGGDAHVDATNLHVKDCEGYVVDGVEEEFLSTVTLGGESSTSGQEGSSYEVASKSITLENSRVDVINGGNLVSYDPQTHTGTATLTIDERSTLHGLYYMDDIYLHSTVELDHVLFNEQPTVLHVSGMNIGDTVLDLHDTTINCDDFVMAGGDLNTEENGSEELCRIKDFRYTIQASATDGGTITPAGSVSVTNIEDAKFQAKAQPGYVLSELLVDGIPVTSDHGMYIFQNISSDHSIEAQFEKLHTEVQKSEDTTVPNVNIQDDEAFLNSIFSEQDLEEMANGADISVQLHVGVEEKPKADVMHAMKSALQDKEVALYLDLGLNKMKGTASNSITNLDHEITLSVQVPDEYIKENREFTIIRTHETANGTYEVRELKDLDNDPTTITFKTDRFSVYAIVYQSEKINDDQGDQTDNNENNDASDKGENNGGESAGKDEGNHSTDNKKENNDTSDKGENNGGDGSADKDENSNNNNTNNDSVDEGNVIKETGTATSDTTNADAMVVLLALSFSVMAYVKLKKHRIL